MAEPEKVKYARQVVAAQVLADLALNARQLGAVLWEDYPLLPEREFLAVEALALQVAPPPAEQYTAAYEFLASLADNDDDSSYARGGSVHVAVVRSVRLGFAVGPASESEARRG